MLIRYSQLYKSYNITNFNLYFNHILVNFRLIISTCFIELFFLSENQQFTFWSFDPMRNGFWRLTFLMVSKKNTELIMNGFRSCSEYFTARSIGWSQFALPVNVGLVSTRDARAHLSIMPGIIRLCT